MSDFDSKRDIEAEFREMNAPSRVPRIFGLFLLPMMAEFEKVEFMRWVNDLISPWSEWSATLKPHGPERQWNLLTVYRRECAGDMQAMLDGELPMWQ